MDITFAGAANEVTGSCHLVRVNGRTLALDCGMFQGRRAESREKNSKRPVPVASIDAVILSHAHIDHAGRLPFLVREGYANRIWATPATRDLCAIMLADSEGECGAEAGTGWAAIYCPGELPKGPDWIKQFCMDKTYALAKRHSGGGVYLMADGHAKWMRREAVLNTPIEPGKDLWGHFGQ